MSAGSQWLSRLSEADHAPWAVADRWRSAGGRVVGLFGRYAPRELVTAAGMLAVTLSAENLPSPVEEPAPPDRGLSVAEGLRAELSPEALAVLEAVVGGRLRWIDGLLIGRDDEAHTKLFYTLREMADDSEFAARVPALGFADILRLPLRTSARYNRTRLSQLRDLMAEWAGHEIGDEAIRTAIADDCRTKDLLRSLRGLRNQGRAGAAETLIAQGGALCLPAAEAQRELLAALDAVGGLPAQSRGPTVYVTGSQPVVEAYRLLEGSGLAIAGDDHEWGQAPHDLEPCRGDPLDWLADDYQFSPVGAARSGLDRLDAVVARVRELDVSAVLQLILPGDEASGWEYAELQMRLRPMPVVSVELQPGTWRRQLDELAQALNTRLRSHPAGVGPATVEAP